MKKIIIYSTTLCPFCKQTKEWLTEKGYEYEDRNVQENPEYRDEMLKKSGAMTVPIVDIEGVIIIGYNTSEMEKALAFDNTTG